MTRIAFLIFPLVVSTVRAETIEVRDDPSLRTALAKLQPGDVLRMAPGRYRPGLHVRDLHGTGEKPIIIEGSDPADPPHFEGGSQAAHFSDCSHLILRHWRITGASRNGINIDDGGSDDTPAHHIAIRNFHISGIGPRGNCDAIKLSGLDDFVVQDCVIEGWGGEGIDMVGCHRGRLEGCTLRGKDGYSQASGLQTKGGSAEIVIRHCRFEDAGTRPLNLGGSTGMPYFRPLGAKYEARNIAAHDNLIIGGMSAVAFTGLDGGSFHRNTVVHPDKWVFRILQETATPGFPPCRNVEFHHNLVVFRRAEVRSVANIGPNTDAGTFKFHHNLWFASDTPGRSTPTLPSADRNSVTGINPELDPQTYLPSAPRAMPFGIRPPLE